jgi:hypothetical protein
MVREIALAWEAAAGVIAVREEADVLLCSSSGTTLARL